MKKYFSIQLFSVQLLAVILSLPFQLTAQGGEQKIKLYLTANDSEKICKAVVTRDDKPAQGVPLNIYIKRSVGLLPVAVLQNTDENGEVSVNFPVGIPGDTLGNVTVIARLEDDEAIADQQTIAWGKKIRFSNAIDERALWASRSNAPEYLIIISNAIIIGIWGTMGYVVFLLFFRIKKSGIDYHP